MNQYGWRIGKLAWMRSDCIPYGGKIDGWTRLASRLFWCSGYSLALQLRWAYRQGWLDGQSHRPVTEIGLACSRSDELAEHYVNMVLPAHGGRPNG